MKRTDLYELAVTTAKASVTETNPIALSALNVQAAKENKIAPEDFQQFEQYVKTARVFYIQLSRQPLPSELTVAREAAKTIVPTGQPAAKAK